MTETERRAVREFFADEVVVNPKGGRQSKLESRLELADPYSMLALGRVLAKGIRHGEDNWRRVSEREHVSHALAHIYGHLAGDDSEPHLENALCRLMMAVAVSSGQTS